MDALTVDDPCMPASSLSQSTSPLSLAACLADDVPEKPAAASTPVGDPPDEDPAVVMAGPIGPYS